MKRVAWLSDIHLNFLREGEFVDFVARVRSEKTEAIVLTGDIGEAHSLVHWLQRLDDALELPIYFVLGNHDYYFGSIAAVRDSVAELCRERTRLHYLTQNGDFELAPHTAIVGDDGWADARYGDYERSLVMMYDYRLIAELAGMTKRDRWPLLQSLGDAAAAHLREVLQPALETYPHVVVATHVPPLREACWHEGQISDDEWAPHFTCKAVGDALLEIAGRFPRRKITALCGHTHSAGVTHPLDNLEILTGAAKYGEPDVQRVFEWE